MCRLGMPSSHVVVLAVHPVLSITSHIVTHNNHHLVQFWSDLHAAGESSNTRVSKITLLNTSLLWDWLLVQFFEPWIWNVDAAHRAVDTCWIEVNWYLVRFHLVFFISAIAIWMYSWDIMSFHDFEKTFATHSCHSSWNAIRRNCINPNDLISYLDASSFNRWSEYISTKALWCAYMADLLVD